MKKPMGGMGFHLALNELENHLDEANAAYAAAQWRRHFGWIDGVELRRLETVRASLLLDDRTRTMLQTWLKKTRDPLLSRRAALLLRHSRWAAIESQPQIYGLRNHIDQTIITFRPSIGGLPYSRVERSQILRCHPNRGHRRAAWLSTGPLTDQIQDDVRVLMQRRQVLAHELGYHDYVSWALDTVGLSRRWVEAFFEELRQRTEAPYRTWLMETQDNLSLRDSLQPWDLAFAAEGLWTLPEGAFPREGLLPAVRALADGLGLGEAAFGVRVDAADIPYAALCYAIRPPEDVRVLVSPRDGHAHYDVLFHEFGHAMHWRCLDASSPVLRWESPPFNEGMALLWERLASEPDWLMERDEIEPEQVVDFRDKWAKRTLFRIRALIARAAFEFQAYQAVEDDLLTLFQDVNTEYLGVPFDLAPGWVDSPYWTSHPVYLQNYVIGHAVASQTLAALRRRFGRLIGKPEVGAWLADHYYGPGAAVPWTEKVVRATGAPLGSADLTADLGIH